MRPAHVAESTAHLHRNTHNSKLINKPVPSLSQEARKASGIVKVKVVFNETGKVIWARAISGNPLLLEPAQQAAYEAKFKPITLSGKAVKVMGVLVFDFAP